MVCFWVHPYSFFWLVPYLRQMKWNANMPGGHAEFKIEISSLWRSEDGFSQANMCNSTLVCQHKFMLIMHRWLDGWTTSWSLFCFSRAFSSFEHYERYWLTWCWMSPLARSFPSRDHSAWYRGEARGWRANEVSLKLRGGSWTRRWELTLSRLRAVGAASCSNDNFVIASGRPASVKRYHPISLDIFWSLPVHVRRVCLLPVLSL